MADYTNPRAHACQNCVKAKAKCDSHTNGRCERCKRLKKNCVTQAPVMRGPRTARATRDSQTKQLAALKHDLDGLVSFLGAPLQPSLRDGLPPVAPGFPSALPSSTGTLPDHECVISHKSTVVQDNQTVFYATGNSLPSGATVTDRQILESTPFTSDKPAHDMNPEVLLNIFRHNLARLVPFISVPSTMTAETLSIERPFLYRAIIAVVSYHDSIHQIVLYQEFVKDLMERLLIYEQKNIDLLQGLLLFISLYNKFLNGSHMTNTLCGLAFSLLMDLSLHLPRNNQKMHEKFDTEVRGIITSKQRDGDNRVEVLRDEKKAILGCFYLFSCWSSNLSKLNPLPWSSYLQHCRENISKHTRNDNDVYFVHLLELQRISENIKHSGIRGIQPEQQTGNSYIGVHIKILMSELQKFRASLPENLQHNAMMLMHYHAAEVHLFELGFSMQPGTLVHAPSFQRADVLLLCLSACRAIIYTYLCIDPEDYVGFSTLFCMHVFLAVTTLSKLSLFSADDWDVSIVHSTMDLSTIVDRMIDVAERASSQYDQVDHRKPWIDISRVMKQVRLRFERSLISSRSSDSFEPILHAEDESMASWSYFNEFDLLEDRFWQSLPDGIN